MNTSSKMQERANKRREILKGRIKGACVLVDILAFFFALGIVGGLEADRMTIGQFLWYGIITLGVVAVSVTVYRAMEVWK